MGVNQSMKSFRENVEDKEFKVVEVGNFRLSFDVSKAKKYKLLYISVEKDVVLNESKQQQLIDFLGKI